MAAEQLYRIQIVNRDQEFVCTEDQALLIGMERRSASSINVGCRGGGCGVCKIRILNGDYESKRMSRAHISQAEEKQGFALACRVFPRGDMVVESDHYIAPEKSPYQKAAAQVAAS